MKKLTHPELRLKSIQNCSTLSSFGGNSCKRRKRAVNAAMSAEMCCGLQMFYLSGVKESSEAGEGVDPDRPNTGKIKSENLVQVHSDLFHYFKV